MSKIEDNLTQINKYDSLTKVETPKEEELKLAQILINKGLTQAQENPPIDPESVWREFENVREEIIDYLSINQDQ